MEGSCPFRQDDKNILLLQEQRLEMSTDGLAEMGRGRERKAWRSNSPLRWVSTEAFEEGPRRKAMSSLDIDMEPEDKSRRQAGTKSRGAETGQKLMSGCDDAQDVSRSQLGGREGGGERWRARGR